MDHGVDAGDVGRLLTSGPAIEAPTRALVSAEEWQVRTELAACYHLIDHYKMSDLVYTHVSARVPGRHDQFLINAFGLMFDEVTASNLVKLDADGKILFDRTGYGANTAGFVIHSAVHEARPDIACVLHIHSAAGMGVSCHPQGLLPITQHALAFYGRIGYHDYEGISFDVNERARLARDLANNNVMILRNHGLLVCGRSIPEAFLLMFILERACQAQVAAFAGGVTPNMPSAEAIAVTATLTDPAKMPPRRDEHAWNALIRLLDRVSPSYAT